MAIGGSPVGLVASINLHRGTEPLPDEPMARQGLEEKASDAARLRAMLAFATARLPPGPSRPGCFAGGRGAAAARLGGALLLEQNAEWAVQRARCMTPETIAQNGDAAGLGLADMTG